MRCGVDKWHMRAEAPSGHASPELMYACWPLICPIRTVFFLFFHLQLFFSLKLLRIFRFPFRIFSYFLFLNCFGLILFDKIIILIWFSISNEIWYDMSSNLQLCSIFYYIILVWSFAGPPWGPFRCGKYNREVSYS